MPVFNGENYLNNSFKSLFNQTLKDIELICVDDGSTDNSLQKLYELKEKYGLVKIYTQKNQGSGKARNYGMDKATGEYIAFLDADDIFVDKDALEKMYDFGKKHDANMVGGNLKRVSEDGTLEDNFNYKEGNYAYFSKFEIIKPEEYGIPWAFYKNIFKTEFLNKYSIRFPDLKRGQDPVLLAEVLTKIDNIPVVPVDLYGYNYAAGGGANSKVNDYTKKLDFIKHYKETFKILEEAGFDDLSNRYKEKLEIHLRLNRNRNDQEMHDIVWELFLDDSCYDTHKEKLFNLRVPNILDNFDNGNFKENHQIIKNSFFNMNFVADYFIPYDMLEKYFKILDSNEHKLKKTSINTIININKTIKNKRKELTDNKTEISKYKNYLNEVNSSLDTPYPHIFVEDIVQDSLNDKIQDLQIKLLHISLDGAEYISPELLRKYVNISNKSNVNLNDNLTDFLKKQKYILETENGYLVKQKEILKEELKEKLFEKY